jgi:hypothetical protein
MLCKIYTVIKKQIIEWACLIWADTVMRSSNTRMGVLGNNLINFGKVQLVTALIVS